jgi:iron(III) transport system ATP-binding protein
VTALTLDGVSKVFQRAGTVVDSISLQVGEGEFFTLLGPSGCGKSTILRLIAGLEEPSSGRILFGQRDVTFDPPNRRGVGLVFQHYALFPHLSVAQNVAFGLEVRKLSSSETNARVAAALEQVQLGGLGEARVEQLSGGQQQRVALARALVIRPSLLLLDEPLSNLDAKLRAETRAWLRSFHNAGAVTTLYVTHDQDEALGMSDRIAVLNAGRIHQVGSPREIYERPATRFVAAFIGRNNILEAVVAGVSEDSVVLRLDNGGELRAHPAHRAAEVTLRPATRVGLCIRAECLRLTDGPGAFSGTLSDIEYSGSAYSCVVATELGELRIEVPGSAALPPRGGAVRLEVDESQIHLVGAA